MFRSLPQQGNCVLLPVSRGTGLSAAACLSRVYLVPSSGAPEFSGNLRRPASAGALKKENNPSQAPLWARPPKYKLCGAPEDVIQVFSFLLRQAAGNTNYATHRMMRYRVKPLLRQVAGLLYPVLLPVPFFYRKIPKKAYLWMNYSFRVAPRPLLYLLNGTVGAYL